MGLPVVATSDAHYLTRDDAAAHDVLLCINTGKTVDDPTRMRFETEEFYRPQPRGDVRRDAGPRGGAGHLGADRRDGRAALREPRPGPALLPLVSARRTTRRPRTTSASSARQGLRERYGENPPPEALERLDHELGDHQPDGVRLLLPDRLGLRPLRARAGHSRARPAARPAGRWSATCSSSATSAR